MAVTPKVSLVATVLNERASLESWIGGLLAQHRLPDEIIIVDGGSRDGTYEALRDREWPFSSRVLLVPGSTIAEGRNAAIAAARYEIVVVTDAGTVAEPQWLERLVEVFDDPRIDVAAGFFVPRLETRWQRALAAATLPDVEDVNPERFQPSSRAMALRMTWWRAGVRYPEWLDYGEDLVWDFAMRRAGARFLFVPDARVVFGVRPSLSAFVTQYFRYARGDGKAGLFVERHMLRYVTYAGLLWVLARRSSRGAVVALPLALLYFRAPLKRLARRNRHRGQALTESMLTIPLVVSLRATGDLAKMVGYPFGLWWRVRQRGRLGESTSWTQTTPVG